MYIYINIWQQAYFIQLSQYNVHGYPKTALHTQFLHHAVLPQCLHGNLVGNFIQKENIEFEVTTDKEPTEEQFSDLIFAWKVCKYIKSNAIIFAKNQQTIGIGAGQMSRVNSAKIAALKAAAANLETKGSVMASDGFFPFSDSIEMASNNGISCIGCAYFYADVKRIAGIGSRRVGG